MTRKKSSKKWLVGALAISLASLAGAPSASANGHSIKSHEHEAERAGMKLALFEKWAAGDETRFKTNGKVILLIHGATWSSHCTFDAVPSYSLMDTLADDGWDVFALDLHGYGQSGKTEKDWTESPSAAEDIDAAIDYIRAYRWVEKVHVFGYQWGSQPAGIFAMKHPNKVGKLVLFGMRSTPEANLTEPTSQYRNNGASNAMLKPDDGDLDQEFVRRRSQVCLAADPQSPNGAKRDMMRQSFVDPLRIKSSTMLIMGDRDADAETVSDRLEFYKALATHSKWFVTVPGLGKFAPVERGRARFEAALMSFLDLP